MRWIDQFLKMEEINGHEVCPTYMYRWTLLRTPWFAIYVHHFVGDDWSRDMHDHPKRFISIGLRGRYMEETPSERGERWIANRTFTAPWVRTFPAEHIHRIRMYEGEDAWTLVAVLKTVRPWGFWHEGSWIPWRQYVNSDTANAMKSCED